MNSAVRFRKNALRYMVPVAKVPASVAELGSDWYLDRIEVTGPEGVCWRFPCDAWFGRTEGDDYTGVCSPESP